MTHPLRTAAISLQDQAAMNMDLIETARVAHILASAAEAGDVPTPRVRGWLHTRDLDTPRTILTQHGTPTSYGLARDLFDDQDVRQSLDRISDVLTDVELDRGDDGSYDYFADPRPQWLVRIVWPNGAVDHDAIKANTQKQAIERADWNWPGSARVFVSYDHGHDEELAEAEEDSMWDYTPSRSELE